MYGLNIELLMLLSTCTPVHGWAAAEGREYTVITPGGYKVAAFGAGPGHPDVFYNYQGLD